MELKQATDLAIEICESLKPFTDKLHIAGSIRRKKPEVKDIEIVLRPKLEAITSNDLFSGDILSYDIITGFTNAVMALGQVEKGNTRGKYLKIVLAQGINLDLFIPDEVDFYRQYAIRTGSADYSFKVIANGWRKIGWCGSDLGLRLEKDCVETKMPNGKSTWKCVRDKNNAPPVWQSEQEFFDWIKVKWIKPEFRNI